MTGTYKIYKIIADAPDGRFYCYIGSTKLPLHYRIANHEDRYRNQVKYKDEVWHADLGSFKCLSQPWYEIALVEDLGNVSKQEAFRKEGETTKRFMADNEYIVVNKNVAGRTSKERYKDKKEEVKARTKQYREEHRAYYKQYNKEYNIKNKEKLREQQREYARKHPKKHVYDPCVCECGATISKRHKKEHEMTMKHQSLIKAK